MPDPRGIIVPDYHLEYPVEITPCLCKTTVQKLLPPSGFIVEKAAELLGAYRGIGGTHIPMIAPGQKDRKAFMADEERTLRSISSPQNYLFSLADLATIRPEQDRNGLIQIASRAIATGFLSRACKGLYLLADTARTGHELFSIAAKL